jgi:hypothetical protein
MNPHVFWGASIIVYGRRWRTRASERSDARQSQRSFEWRLQVFMPGSRWPSTDVTDFDREQIVANVLERLAAWRSGCGSTVDNSGEWRLPEDGETRPMQ